MAGKFLQRGAIIDTLHSEQAANSFRKRAKLTRHPVRAYPCGCPDPNCGAFHLIDQEHTIPTAEECKSHLAADNQSKARKPSKTRRKKK